METIPVEWLMHVVVVIGIVSFGGIVFLACCGSSNKPLQPPLKPTRTMTPLKAGDVVKIEGKYLIVGRDITLTEVEDYIDRLNSPITLVRPGIIIPHAYTLIKG